MMLRLEHVEAGYGSIACLHDVSLEVPQGEIIALVGANGAGKTTTLLAISGLLSLRHGRIMFEDSPLQGQQPSAIVARGISHVPEGRRILPRLSVRENLVLGAYCRTDQPLIREDLDRMHQIFPVLHERRHQLAGTLSGGEQQMLAMARGLMARPKVLLLDEPSLGLAPKLVLKIFEIIQRINQQGMTILLVEQNAYQALQIAHRGYVLESGRIVLADTAKKLIHNEHVKAAYLGG